MVFRVFVLVQVLVAFAFSSETKLLASDGSDEDRFGHSVSVSGNFAIVGAHLDDEDGQAAGSAYVFARDEADGNNWVEVKKLGASDGGPNLRFGTSVSISGNVAIVGSDTNSAYASSAYVFTRNHGGTDKWGESAKLNASGVADDLFGRSVCISGDLAIVGAPGFNMGRGAAFVFRNEGGTDDWELIKNLVVNDGATSDNFGSSVSIAGDLAVVGAYGNNLGRGSAYIFARNKNGTDNWGQVKKLTASDGSENHLFGFSVSISEDLAVVGTYSTSANAAYVFARNWGGTDNWGQLKKLTADDGTELDYFGRDVSVSGEEVIVGTYASSANAAYIFVRNEGGSNNWGQLKKLVASDMNSQDLFGAAVSISGDVAFVGASLTDDNGPNSGATYVFKDDFSFAPLFDRVAVLEQSVASLNASVLASEHCCSEQTSLISSLQAANAQQAEEIATLMELLSRIKPQCLDDESAERLLQSEQEFECSYSSRFHALAGVIWAATASYLLWLA